MNGKTHFTLFFFKPRQEKEIAEQEMPVGDGSMSKCLLTVSLDLFDDLLGAGEIKAATWQN